MGGDGVVRGAAAAEEPVGVRRAGDAHHQPPRREGHAVRRRDALRAERDEAFVGAERRPDEADALQQAQDATLHGYS